MFNSTILDVAIGMVFVYLLLSLICSAANELIELALKKRAIDLERGIRELLVPGSESGADDLVAKLYDHALVNGLFGGRYEDTGIASRLRYIWRTQLPTYIPSRSFALALMDLVLPGTVGGSPTVSTPSGAAGAAPTAFDVKLGTPPPPPSAPTGALANLRAAIGSNPLLAASPQAQQALISLIDAAGNDAAKARQNIEDWFNASMDRVSGWYKRRAQVFIFIIGLFVAISVNADSVMIAKRLATDRSLRDALVSAAQDYAKANATASPTGTPSNAAASLSKKQPTTTEAATTPANPNQPTEPSPTPTPTPATTPATTPNEQPAAGAKSTPTPTPTPAATPNGTPTPCWQQACQGNEGSDECLRKKAECALAKCSAEECAEGKDSPRCKLAQAKCEIDSLGLPIGWKPEEWPGFAFWKYDDVWTNWAKQIRIHFFGWLLTALAISLGAPFWFDLLNKFIVVRSTVKPKEKSPEEKSKD